MKKFMALLLTFALCLSLCGITAAALKEELDISAKETYSGTCGENLTWTYSTESQELSISGTGEMVNYGNGSMAPWNDYRDSIKSVVISDGVTSIGRCAFYLCSSLSSVTLPDSIMSICGQAFQGCRTLMSITIPAKVTTIENDAFKYCYRLVEVINHSSLDLSNTQQFGLTYIAWYSLEVHSGESKLSVVNDYVFYPLTNDKIYLVHYSGDATSLVLPSNYNGERYEIHKYAFCYMSNLESVSIPNGIDFLASSSFIYCSSLKSVVIPDSVTDIKDYAFYYCTSLESIAIPDSVTYIGNYAFNNCTALKSISIPDSVDSINNGTFGYCTSLASITIPDSVDTIASYAFERCYSLKSVTIGDSVTSIGTSAFNYCSALEGITIPDSVDSVGAYAFSWCSALKRVSMGNSVTSIGSNSFENCDSLESITLPNSVTTLGGAAFLGCDSLKSIAIPASVTFIGGNPSRGCTSLTSINVDTNNKYYLSDNGVLFNKEKTKLICYPAGKNDSSYIIPSSVTSVEDGAFGDCNALTNVIIPYGVTAIGGSAFYSCDSLASITIPDSVDSVGTSAFEYCASLVSITLGDSITSINYGAFNNCTALRTVYYCGTEAQWNAINIKDRNYALTSANRVYIPHFNFAEGADTEDVTVGTSSRQTYFKAGGMTVAEIKALYAEGDIIITKANGTVLTDNSLVGTGCVIASTLHGTTKHHKVVVLGDINGDGKVNATDYSQVLNHAKGKVQLSGVKLTAANVSAATSATINAADYGQVLGFATGKTLKFNTVVE